MELIRRKLFRALEQEMGSPHILRFCYDGVYKRLANSLPSKVSRYALVIQSRLPVALPMIVFLKAENRVRPFSDKHTALGDCQL